jgi:tRNA G26 N,N-dimethylase Trm1
MERRGELSKTYVNEYNVRLLVDESRTCPKKSEVFYNEDITLNRLCWLQYFHIVILYQVCSCGCEE